jgi:hypothetical protein
MYSLDISQKFVDFEGKEIWADEASKEQFTLRDALIRYFRVGGEMGLNEEEMDAVYSMGLLVGDKKNKKIEISNRYYDILKSITTKGERKFPQGGSQLIFPLEIKQQAKKMVESAKNIDEVQSVEEKEKK